MYKYLNNQCCAAVHFGVGGKLTGIKAVPQKHIIIFHLNTDMKITIVKKEYFSQHIKVIVFFLFLLQLHLHFAERFSSEWTIQFTFKSIMKSMAQRDNKGGLLWRAKKIFILLCIENLNIINMAYCIAHLIIYKFNIINNILF